MASWSLVEKYVTSQSRKSYFGWHRFRFSPCLMRKGWKVWSDTGLTWYLSGAASRMVSLSNYCIWCLFFISNLMKSSVVYAAILFTHVCKIWDNDLTEYQVCYKLRDLKKPSDIFSQQIERKCSKEYLVIILAVKESLERFSCLEFIFEKSKYRGKPA